MYDEPRHVLTVLNGNGITGVEVKEKMQIEDIAEVVAQSIKVQKAQVQN